MKHLNKVAIVFAATAAFASVAGAQEIHNWRSASGDVWKNTSGQCWRDASWTPATAVPACDGVIVEKVAPVARPNPVAPPATQPQAVVAVAPAKAAVAAQTKYTATAWFDFDKSVLKAEGKSSLDDVAAKAKSAKLEVVIAVGHTDSVGTDSYNQKLSIARAEAVKAYLISKGIEKKRIYTEGKGEKQPVADNATTEGRSKNRRVEVEFVPAKAD